MKKLLLFAILVMASTAIFTSCSKDEDNQSDFDYPIESIYGIWNGTEIYLDSQSKWIDITEYPYTKFGFAIRFNSDGTYYGSGYFGDGGGTYKAVGKTITTYIDGEEYAQYNIKTLSNNQAELTMVMGTSAIDMRVKKK